MSTRYLLACPDINPRRTKRIEELENNISSWICSEAFTRLVILFGGTLPSAKSIKEQVSYFNDFADVWDYRKHKANGGERWLVSEDGFLSEHKSEIMESMFALGLTDVMEPKQRPDYIMPLGGARMANLDRCLAANEMCQLYKEYNIPVLMC